MFPAVNSALQGIQHNHQALARHADRTSRRESPDAAGSPADLATEVVGDLPARLGFEANWAVMRAADEMLGSLLAVLA